MANGTITAILPNGTRVEYSNGETPEQIMRELVATGTANLSGARPVVSAGPTGTEVRFAEPQGARKG